MGMWFRIQILHSQRLEKWFIREPTIDPEPENPLAPRTPVDATTISRPSRPQRLRPAKLADFPPFRLSLCRGVMRLTGRIRSHAGTLFLPNSGSRPQLLPRPRNVPV